MFLLSKVIKILLRDATPGDVLAIDLFVERQLIMKQDSILTEKGIDLLKKKGVYFISIFEEETILPIQTIT